MGMGQDWTCNLNMEFRQGDPRSFLEWVSQGGRYSCRQGRSEMPSQKGEQHKNPKAKKAKKTTSDLLFLTLLFT